MGSLKLQREKCVRSVHLEFKFQTLGLGVDSLRSSILGLGCCGSQNDKGVKNPKIRLCSSPHSSVSGWKQCFLKPCGRYYSLRYCFCEVTQLFIFGHKSWFGLLAPTPATGFKPHLGRCH